MSRLSESGLAAVEKLAASHVGADTIPGLVALLAHGDEVHVGTHGSLGVGGPAVRRDSLFRIASTTKPVIGALITALLDEGLLRMDEPVDRLLPELANPRVLRRADGPLHDTVPAERAITVADLMTSRNGFGMHFDMFTAAEPWPICTAEQRSGLNTFGPPKPQQKPGSDDWLARLGELPLLAQPRQRWLYQTGVSVLGVLAERVTGTALPELLRARIFEPLGMPDTAFWTAETDRLATAYDAGEDGLVVADPPNGAWATRPAFADGASGLVSTVDDLLAFARMFLRGGDPLLRKESVREMCTNQLTAQQAADGTAFLNGRGWGYCQSVITDGPRAGAFGWDGGFGTSWLVDPVREFTVIVLTQRLFGSPAAQAVHTELQDAAYAALT